MLLIHRLAQITSNGNVFFFFFNLVIQARCTVNRHIFLRILCAVAKWISSIYFWRLPPPPSRDRRVRVSCAWYWVCKDWKNTQWIYFWRSGCAKKYHFCAPQLSQTTHLVSLKYYTNPFLRPFHCCPQNPLIILEPEYSMRYILPTDSLPRCNWVFTFFVIFDHTGWTIMYDCD